LHNALVAAEDAGNPVQLFKHLRHRPWLLNKERPQWNQANWGTKVEAYEVDYCSDDWDEGNDSLCLNFLTDKEPPIALFRFLVEEGWTVDAYYHEPDQHLCGRFVNTQGDSRHNYSNGLEGIPEDIQYFVS